MDSYFAEDSMIRRIQGERMVMISGPRALLMQAAHPVAVEGLLAHTKDLDAPYDRLARTAEIMSTVTFGSREDADRVTRRVRAMHRRVRGELEVPAGPFPVGTPYAADDPELLMWVLFTLVDSGIVVYERFVENLTREEKESYWADFRVVGELFGLAPDQMPADLEELDAYREEIYASGRLHLTDWARTQGLEIVFRPPAPIYLQPLVEAVNYITISLLPPVIRDQYGFPPLPPEPIRGVTVRLASEYLKRIVVPLAPTQLRRIPVAR